MLSIPLPLLTSVLCLALIPVMLRLELGRRIAGVFFAVLAGCFALQTLLVGLRFGYGVEDFIILQRLLPLMVGPLMYLGFASLALPREVFRKHAVGHLGAGLALMLCLGLFGDAYFDFDIAIGISYVIYITLLIRLARKGPDALIHTRLGLGKTLGRWMVAAAALLAALLILDTVIALNFAFAGGGQVSLIVSVGSAFFISLLLLFLISQPALRPRTAAPKLAPETPEAKLEATAREMLTRNQLYLDPDLTVQRLARRLTVPERVLSQAINQSQGMNVSQYVNSFRLDHAATLLRGTNDSVSKIMLQSGFLTRSNFYREFQRVYGMSPARYRDTPK